MRGRWISLVAAAACALSLTVTSLALTGCGASGPPDFTLSLGTDQPSSLTVPQGGTVPVSFQVAALQGAAGSIALTISGLPDKVGVAPGSATVGIGSPQTFELTAASNAALTTTPVTLTATGVSGNPLDSSSITHTQTVTISIVAPSTQ